MSDEQLEFPVVPGKRVKKAPPDDLDFEAQSPRPSFLPAVWMRRGSCDCQQLPAVRGVQLRLRNDRYGRSSRASPVRALEWISFI